MRRNDAIRVGDLVKHLGGDVVCKVRRIHLGLAWLETVPVIGQQPGVPLGVKFSRPIDDLVLYARGSAIEAKPNDD